MVRTGTMVSLAIGKSTEGPPSSAGRVVRRSVGKSASKGTRLGKAACTAANISESLAASEVDIPSCGCPLRDSVIFETALEEQ